MLIIPLYVWRVQRRTRQRHQIASISRQHWISNFTMKCSQPADERSGRRKRPASRTTYEPSASEEHYSKVTHIATNLHWYARTKLSVRPIRTAPAFGCTLQQQRALILQPIHQSCVCLFAAVNWAVRFLRLFDGLACVWIVCRAWNQFTETVVCYTFHTSKCNEQLV